ncbi:hypothetical protein MMC07_007286 [Pseudocyphellaria aurata]|nr:hypothetical protein [Pseudocyphellaria aurata]
MCNQTYIPCSTTGCHGVGAILELIECENANKARGCNITYTPKPPVSIRTLVYCPQCTNARIPVTTATPLSPAARATRNRERKTALQRARRAQARAGNAALQPPGPSPPAPSTFSFSSPYGGEPATSSSHQDGPPHSGFSFHAGAGAAAAAHHLADFPLDANNGSTSTTNHIPLFDVDDINTELQQMASWAEGLLRDMRPLWDDHLFVKAFCESRDS